MAVLCFVLGQSGTGKSRSLKNFGKDELAHVNVSGKPLPFKGKFSETIVSHDYTEISRFLKKCSAKSIAIDDSTFLMSFQKWDKAFEKNFDKWTELGKNFTDLLRTCAFDVPDDKIVYFLHHIDTNDDGRTAAKCLGKMINQDATLEAFFTIVLSTSVIDGKYYFLTQNNGKDTTKSPDGMFPSYAIDNDLKYVDDKIRNYYELTGAKSDAEMGQADAAVAADIAKPDANGRRARGGKASKTTTETVTPPQTAEQDAEQDAEQTAEPEKAASTGRSGRTRKASGKTHDEVVAENQQKMSDYMTARDEALDKAFPGQEEIPFDEAAAVMDAVPQPELETPPRRTRKERQANAEQSAEPETLAEDTYFYIPADDNYVMKHKGDVAPEGAKVITKEEFGEGVKRLAQNNDNSVEGAMNPPESGRRTRRTQAQSAEQTQSDSESGQDAEPEQETGTRTRRTRRTR